MPDKKKQKKEKLSITEALETVKNKKMSPKEAFVFLRKNSPKALLIMNPNKWEMEKPDPNFKAPITKKEIEDYNVFSERINKIKSTKDFDDLEMYLKGLEYKPYGAVGYPMLGSNIVESAKKKGTKVIQNEDGSYSMFDDETTFRDTDASYSKPRTIYPDVRYTKNMYRKGKDLVNVYKTNALPEYKNRIPTEDEMFEYSTGKYYTEAATPEMKKYYADVYFDPNNNQSPLTYGSQSNADDIERYAYAKDLGQKLKVEHKKWMKRQEFKQDLGDFFKNIGRGSLSGKISLDTSGMLGM